MNMLFVKTKLYSKIKFPIDGGKKFRDGKRFLGENKTWAGFFGMILSGALSQLLWGFVCLKIPEICYIYFYFDNTPLFNLAAGAAMGTLVAEIVVWIVQFYFLKNDIKNIFIRRSYVYVVVAAAISVLISFWVKWMGWSSFITMAISACLYFGGYILLLSLVKDPLIFEIKKKVCTIYHRIVIR